MFEILQRALSRCLSFVAVYDFSDKSGAIELSADFIRAVLGAGKYNRPLHLRVAQQGFQRYALLCVTDHDGVLLDLSDGNLFERLIDTRRVIEYLVGKSYDVFGHGGGKQQ